MSELFDSVFDSECGGCLRTCECGITHFDSYNISCWEHASETLENLQMNAKHNPKKFIEHDQAIGATSISGIEIVIGCTCDIAQKYENFIIQNGPKIAEYLNKRAEILKEQARSIKVK